MNNDLISRSELKKALHNFFDGKVIDEPTYILRDIFCYIDNAPTVSPEKALMNKLKGGTEWNFGNIFQPIGKAIHIIALNAVLKQ